MRRLLPFTILVLVACSASGGENPLPSDAGANADLGAPPLCTPGAQVACACPGGAASVQVCQTNGTLGACACGDGGTAAVDAGRTLVALFVDCSVSNPCEGDAVCLMQMGSRGFTVNFCTLRCDGVTKCPLGAVCGSLSGGTSYCLQRCTDPGTASCGFSYGTCGTVSGVDGYVCRVP